MTRWFEASPVALSELRAKLRRDYPTLNAHIRDSGVVVEGSLPLVGDEGDVLDRYTVQISLPGNYPHGLPDVWEIGGRIPREQDRHVFPRTGALCLGFPVELWLLLGGDFEISNFILKAVIPYLVGNSLVEDGKPWPFGESVHGPEGGLQFFERYLGSNDPLAIGKFLLALGQGKVKGHWPCPCGSGKNLRNCHDDRVRQLRQVPLYVLEHSIDQMIAILERRATPTD